MKWEENANVNKLNINKPLGGVGLIIYKSPEKIIEVVRTVFERFFLYKQRSILITPVEDDE